MKRDVKILRGHHLSLGLAMALVGTAFSTFVTGCGPPTSSSETPGIDIESVTSAQTITSVGTAAYDTECANNQVPLPPVWGTDKLGNGTNGTWKSNGPYSDTYFGISPGAIYYSQSTSPAGICVINAHASMGSCGLFDLICQGANGKACFWEGNLSANIPATGIPLLPTRLQGGTDLEAGTPTQTSCPSCHAGENVFIAHEAPGHALNLGSLWMPTTGNWMNPLVKAQSIQNPMPGATQLTGYPVSTSGCTTCHVAGVGGRFPQLSKYAGSGGQDYCDILARVTNRPAASSGMPPAATNTCTPDVDCALQTDPFVKAMMASCPQNNGVQIAVSSSWSPVAVSAQAGTTGNWPGWYDHFVADNATSGMTRGNNRYNNGQFQGWGLDNANPFIPTSWRATGWVKSSSGDGNEYTVAATDNTGTIWEYSKHGRNRVTQVWNGTAVGSPMGYKRHDGNQAMVFRGTVPGNTTMHIYEALWNGSFWSQISQLPDQGADGDPIAYARGQSSSVIYKCGTLLCELRLAGGAWYFRDFRPLLPSAMPLKARADGDGYGSTMPAAMWFANYGAVGQGNIFYTAADGVHVIKDDADPWFSGTVTESLTVADSTVASSPSVYHNDGYWAPEGDQYSGDSIVYRAGSGTSGQIIELKETGGGTRVWTKTTVYSAQANEILSDDVASYLETAPWTNIILFRNAAHNLKQARYNYTSQSYAIGTIY